MTGSRDTEMLALCAAQLWPARDWEPSLFSLLTWLRRRGPRDLGMDINRRPLTICRSFRDVVAVHGGCTALSTSHEAPTHDRREIRECMPHSHQRQIRSERGDASHIGLAARVRSPMQTNVLWRRAEATVHCFCGKIVENGENKSRGNQIAPLKFVVLQSRAR